MHSGDLNPHFLGPQAWIEAKNVQLPIADESVVNDGLRLFDRRPGFSDQHRQTLAPAP